MEWIEIGTVAALQIVPQIGLGIGRAQRQGVDEAFDFERVTHPPRSELLSLE